MTRPPKKSGFGRQRTVHNDRKLWEEWAKNITPIKLRKNRVPLSGQPESKVSQTQPNPFAEKPTKSDTNARLAGFDKSETNRAVTGKLSANHTVKNRSTVPHRVPQLADFDKKSRRRLGAGQIQIGARLDLHGMRQNEAHDALRGFLQSAHARGLRWVLVITGKGKPTRHGYDFEEGEDWNQLHDANGPQGRGILRRSVPQWLTEADMRAIVVSHTTAAPHHGGEGARYIQLRSKRRNA